MLRLTVIVAATLLGAAVSARADDQQVLDKNCDGGTYEMVDCIGAKTSIWDKRLNAAYDRALKEAEPKQQELLRHAERAWLKFRDAHCDYVGAEEGSIARIDYAECLRSLTERRARELGVR
jgi:uncharacterized protein YecT (DUF1311 family)